MEFTDDDVATLRIALARISRQVDRQGSGDDMTRTQLSVLGSIARAEVIGLGELAEIEGLNPTMLSRIVAKLETRGLIKREPAVDDRRAINARVTAKGEKLHLRLRAQRTKLLRTRLAELPAEHTDKLLEALPALESLAEHMLRQKAAAL